MKKIFCGLLAVILCLGLCGCEETIPSTINETSESFIGFSAIPDKNNLYYDVDTKIDLLNSGADSFMIYDYNENELIAVVGSILRRYYKDFGVNIYDFKSLQVNFYEKTVKINGESINIVAKMYELFEYLIRHKEIILSKNTLFNRVWGFESETTFSVVEVYISKLRKVLEQGGLANHLLTIKNAGYCWTEKENN